MWLRGPIVACLLGAVLLSPMAGVASASMSSYHPGSIDAADPLQSGALADADPATTCSAPTSAARADGNPRHYDLYSYTNRASSPVCIQVSVDASGCAGSYLHSAAYTGSFNAAAPESRYLGDIGDATNATKSYSFNAPAGQAFAVVVSEADASAACAHYELFVSTPQPWVLRVPAIVGRAHIGSALQVGKGHWLGGETFSYQWLRCGSEGGSCVPVVGRTGTSYSLDASDVGHRIRVRETATDSRGSTSADSAPTGVVRGPDTTPPGIKSFQISASVFAVGREPTPVTATRRGTRWAWEFTDALATARFTIRRVLPGRRGRRGRCVRSRPSLRKRRHCSRLRRVGVIKRFSGPGKQRLFFTGRIGNRALKPGRYRVALTAYDHARNASPPRTLHFRIVRR